MKIKTLEHIFLASKLRYANFAARTPKNPRPPGRGRERKERCGMRSKRGLFFVNKVYETTNLDEAAAMLTQGGWVIIAAVKQKDGYLFSLGFTETIP